MERFCYMADPQVAERARAENTTRAAAAVDRWAAEHPAGIFAVGNAPTALLRLAEWMEAGKMHPALVIGAPVGFVNVVESKGTDLVRVPGHGVPAIVAMGRKGAPQWRRLYATPCCIRPRACDRKKTAPESAKYADSGAVFSLEGEGR